MIDRYCRPEMKAIWELENRYRTWLQVEMAICEAWAELGVIPAEAVARIRAADIQINVERFLEIEAEVRHDVIAFVQGVAEQLGEEGKYLHFGVTSYDVVDTALSLLLVQSADLIEKGLRDLRRAIFEQARQHKATLMIGRTHGVHAEPITLGFKLCVWLAELDRSLERLRAAREMVRVGKVSGAVGTYANVDPRVEEIVCQRLNLQPALVSTQILQRDRHAQFLTTLAILAGSLEKFATEVRNLQRTEILEIEEPFQKGQKGSSAMPHKRNPITCEQISGLCRVVRANALAGLENIPTWHERDLSNSSVERVILPDSCLLIDYMLDRFTQVVRGWTVSPERMQRNLNLTHGVIFSQQVRLALTEKGLSYEEAYEIAQGHAHRAWEEGLDYRTLLEQDERVTRVLTPEEIQACFDTSRHTEHLDRIFERFGL
jgi:adenylosuccinate lyase